jgi:hypothetical protein
MLILSSGTGKLPRPISMQSNSVYPSLTGELTSCGEPVRADAVIACCKHLQDSCSCSFNITNTAGAKQLLRRARRTLSVQEHLVTVCHTVLVCPELT